MTFDQLMLARSFNAAEVYKLHQGFMSGLHRYSNDAAVTLSMLNQYTLGGKGLYVASGHFEDVMGELAPEDLEGEELEEWIASLGHFFTEVDTPSGNFQLLDPTPGDLSVHPYMGAEPGKWLFQVCDGPTVLRHQSPAKFQTREQAIHAGLIWVTCLA